MSTIIEDIERRQMRKRVPRFDPGDRVRVHFQVVEGSRRRTQVFEGIVIARQGAGARETFTVRKQSFGVGVERTFPVHSPKIERLEVVARGAVRRAKLYYLRGRVGKAARVAERRWGIDEDMVSAPATAAAIDAEGVSQEEVVPVEAPEGAETKAEGGEESTEAPAEVEEAPAAEEAAAEPETSSEPEAPAEPEAEAESETAAETDADAPEAGETEDKSAPEDAEDEEPAKSGDSDEDSAA